MQVQNQNSGKPNALPCVQTPVSGSVFFLTEKRFRDFFSNLPNGSYHYENGKQIIIHSLWRKIDNQFNLSYHLNFEQKNIQFNFWFDKLSYLNAKESVSISSYDSNEKHYSNDSKKIFSTNLLNELKEKVDELFVLYK